MTTCRPTSAHGWKYIAVDKDGWFYLPFGPPFNIGIPPTSVSQIRRVDPKTGNAEIWALGVRNSVGGDVDPRSGRYWFTENARDWISDDMPSDKLNMITKIGEHFGYPYCHQGDMPDPKFAMGHKCSEFTPPVVNLGAHVAPLGMKFYTGDQFPAEYKNNILIAEHGSWNRHKYQGARIKRVIVDADGKNAKSEIFASGWLEGDRAISAVRTTSCWPRTVRSWWPTTGPVRSIASATRSRTSTIKGLRLLGNGWPQPLLSGMWCSGGVAHANCIGRDRAGGGNRLRLAIARAADIAAGKAKAELCVGCHGENGISQMENIPSLAAQPDLFIQWQLVFFRAGTRKNEQMQPIVEQLNNEDIRNLGAYFASLEPPKAAKPDDNPDLSKKGAQAAVGRRCASCHPDTTPAPRRSPASPASARIISSRRCATTNRACDPAAPWRRWRMSPSRSARKRSRRSRIISRISERGE